MAIIWSHGQTKVISSNNQDGIEDYWSHGKSVIMFDGTLADRYSDGVGVDAKLYKQMSPIPDSTYVSRTDKEFDSDAQETIVSKGY